MHTYGRRRQLLLGLVEQAASGDDFRMPFNRCNFGSEQGLIDDPVLGQLRLAPSGHVVGVDMDVALSLASARGYDVAELSELVPAAEAGFVEALCADADRPIEA